MLTITDAAKDYLVELLAKQNTPGMSVRVFITQPGTPYAETCLAYCRPDEVNPNDEVMDQDELRVYLDKQSILYLEDAKIDFAKDKMGGQLTIKAPNAKMPKVNDDSPIQDQVNYILYNEINPGLASHGGEVKLVEVTEDNLAILEFGGGCQGCSAVDITLKEGIEKTLLSKLPQLSGIRDATDHTQAENAYM
ncbi:Fe-S biogenesis protein NfuA [Bermanella marisrubri]|uniref:Fe/S biogenesis protein NfuA n=1 Tax=Bermanella marisrubri TaxID=207949 RepID=Q1MXY2_9GAMM|nr:Fe-S biogenesis protein NfuA [Bermanella marisrubri]EAT10847.1 Thioredoxin-like protein [Oceanobacter sp. RED65] [Bermanella marisrubri]QIZ84228.1 Fe-S biogenesis protein NfuA [Bermanella marisrubri]